MSLELYEVDDYENRNKDKDTVYCAYLYVDHGCDFDRILDWLFRKTYLCG